MPRVETELIVLRKTPFQETGLILAGLTHDWGRLDVLVKGGRSVGGKKNSIADIFRVVSLEVDPERDGLQTAYSLELVEANDGIASRSGSYLDACAVAEFASRNSRQGVECRRFASAVRAAFARLDREEAPFAPMLVKLVFLHDHGLLPEPRDDDEATAKVVESLLETATTSGPLPPLPEEYLARFSRWVDSVCLHHDLKI